MVIEDLSEYTGFELALLGSSAEWIVATLDKAIQAACEEPNSLLKIGASEQAIAHRIAFQLEVLLRREGKSWDVDCEYNRLGNGNDSDGLQQYLAKRLDLNKPKRLVNPDLVVHKRGTSDNELVVEMKVHRRSHSTRSKVNFDLKKLKVFHDDEDFGYREAVFIMFYIGNTPHWELHRYSPPAESSNIDA